MVMRAIPGTGLAVSMLALGLLSFAALPAAGQSADSQRLKMQESCASMAEDQLKAMDTDDWKAIIRIKDRYVRTCREVATDSNMASAHQAAGFAHVQLAQYTKGVESASACIELRYSNAICHVIKTEALLRDKRLKEGREAHNVASKLVAKAIEGARQDEMNAKEAREGKSEWKFALEPNDTLKNLRTYEGHLRMLAGEYLGQR